MLASAWPMIAVDRHLVAAARRRSSRRCGGARIEPGPGRCNSSVSSSLRNSLPTGPSGVSLSQRCPYLVMKTRSASSASLASGRCRNSSFGAATVSGHSGHRRSIAVFGLREVEPSRLAGPGRSLGASPQSWPEAAIDAEQDHRSQRLIGRLDDRPQVRRLEHASRRLLGGSARMIRFAGRLNVGPKRTRRIDQAGVNGVLEEHPHPLNHVRERNRAVAILHQLARKASKSSAARSATRRCLPNDSTTTLAIAE